MVKAISYAKVKTDKVDAKTLAERLMAVPGLGKVGAWTIMAEIGVLPDFLLRGSSSATVGWYRAPPTVEGIEGISLEIKMVINTCGRLSDKRPSPLIPTTRS